VSSIPDANTVFEGQEIRHREREKKQRKKRHRDKENR
jgi:hypothetical protein